MREYFPNVRLKMPIILIAMNMLIAIAIKLDDKQQSIMKNDGLYDILPELNEFFGPD